MVNTNLKCAANERPIIAGNITGYRKAVIDGASGFLREAKDAISLF